MLFSGRGYPELGLEIAGCLGIDPTPTTAYDFANGEIFVRFLESVRGSDAFVLQSHTAPINQWIMEQLIMVDALKRASAKRITVVMPFFGYARQDKKTRGGEPISARLIADLFATAGADRLMAVDLHTAQIQGFFDGPVDHLLALPILAGYLESKLNVRNVTVVAPDAGRVRVCERWTAPRAVLSGPAVDQLKSSRISEVVITNTLPVAQEKRFDNLTVLSIAPLIARAITEVFNDGSVTSLFDGQS